MGCTAVEIYREIRRELGDERAGALVQLHGRHIVCKAGCHDCCTNLSVYPVEFYAILEDLRAAGLSGVAFDGGAECGFLKQGLCSIYAVRPMICRTHGLPIAFADLQGDEAVMSVSFCPKNFAQTSEEELAFGPESTLDLDDLNVRLYEANLQFLEEHPELGLDPSTRISLGDLAAQLSSTPDHPKG